MTLTRDFKETVAARVQSDSAFARVLPGEAITLFVNGEPEPAKLIWRDPSVNRVSIPRFDESRAMESSGNVFVDLDFDPAGVDCNAQDPISDSLGCVRHSPKTLRGRRDEPDHAARI